ncbi:MAG: hypothetical protein OSA97_11700 [Nevskia sp.]|nr:hypothetical protein [Nevskia sp.]
MSQDWISFPALLRCWGALLLLPLVLASLWKFEFWRPRSALPLVLLALSLWWHAPLEQLAARCQVALHNSAPVGFLDRAFGAVLPS